MKYTVKAYHNDYCVSLLEVEASSSTEALMLACQHYLQNKEYPAPVVKIMLEVEAED